VIKTIRLLLVISVISVCAFCTAKARSADFERQWVHVSETSAVVYWQLADISMSAFSFVEYGTSRELGQRSKQTSRPRWAQYHSLTGLSTGKKLFYRMVNLDPETGQRTESGILTLMPRNVPGAVYLPGEGAGSPPYVLDKPGTHYVLTEDITAAGTGFEIMADSITLDLDGHTLVFGNDTSERVNGVRFGLGEGCKLVNGRGQPGPSPGHRGGGDQHGCAPQVRLPDQFYPRQQGPYPP
jgi:hypothetical protein